MRRNGAGDVRVKGATKEKKCSEGSVVLSFQVIAIVGLTDGGLTAITLFTSPTTNPRGGFEHGGAET